MEHTDQVNTNRSAKTEWTTSELAEAAGLSDARIRQLLIDGRTLKGRKVGPMWVISDSEARRWLENRGP